jgi:predicted molibdopterin-dependent oxidoreductase YjgC
VAARALANAGSVAILFPAELSWLAGQAAVDAVIDLALATACLGRSDGGLYALLAEGNAHGAFDAGAVPDLLPGHQPLSEQAVQERFRAAWGTDVPTEPGLGAAAIYEAAAEKRLQALYIAGENPVAGPNGPAVRAALETAAFVVVQDTRLTETAALADVVLPGTLPQEKAGTVTSNERRVQVLRPAVAPIGDSRPDWQIFQAIARKLGARGFEWDTSDEVTAEMAGVMPIYAGLNPERFDAAAPVCWPIHVDGTGTTALYGDGFAPGLGRPTPLELRPRALANSSLVLRPLAPGGVRAALRPDSGVVQLELAELNAADAGRLAVSDGDVVTVAVNDTSVRARARLSQRVPVGTVGLSAIFEGTAALFAGDAGRVEVRPAP